MLFRSSDITRSQHDNKRDAFVKMVNTPEFKKWHRLEVMRRMGTLAQVEETVGRELRVNTKVEGRKNGKWVDISLAQENTVD